MNQKTDLWRDEKIFENWKIPYSEKKKKKRGPERENLNDVRTF